MVSIVEAPTSPCLLGDDVETLSTRNGAFALLERIAAGASSVALAELLARLVADDRDWLDVDVCAELTRRADGTTVRVIGLLGGGRRELVLPAVRSALSFDELRSALARHRVEARLADIELVQGEHGALLGRFLEASDDAIDVAIDESSLRAAAGGLTPSAAPRPLLEEPWVVDDAWDEPARGDVEERPTVPVPTAAVHDVEERGPETPRQRVSEDLIERSRTRIPAMPED